MTSEEELAEAISGRLRMLGSFLPPDFSKLTAERSLDEIRAIVDAMVPAFIDEVRRYTTSDERAGATAREARRFADVVARWAASGASQDEVSQQAVRCLEAFFCFYEPGAPSSAESAATEDAPTNDLTHATATVSRFAETFARCMNHVGLLAAPRVFERCRREQPAALLHFRAHLVEELQRFINLSGDARAPIIADGARNMGEMVAAVRALLAAVERWPEDAPAPTEAISERARACLAAFGFPAPEEGWDAWEGSAPPETPQG